MIAVGRFALLLLLAPTFPPIGMIGTTGLFGAVGVVGVVGVVGLVVSVGVVIGTGLGWVGVVEPPDPVEPLVVFPPVVVPFEPVEAVVEPVEPLVVFPPVA